MNPFDLRSSLRARLAVAIGGVAFLLSLALSMFLGATARTDLEQTTGETLAQLALQMAVQLDQGLYERYHEVQALATLDAVKDPRNSREKKRALLQQLKRAYPGFVWIGVTDAHGVVQAGTDGVLEGRDISSHPVFLRGRSGPYVGDVHQAMMLARFLPKEGDEPVRLADISAPLLDAGGKREGVLTAYLDLTWARAVEKGLLTETQRKQHVHVLLLDHDGAVLIGPKDLQGQALEAGSVRSAQAGDAGYVKEPWRGRKDDVVGYAPTRGYLDCPGLGWLAIVRQGETSAFAPARRLQEATLLWGMGFAALASVFGWLLAGRIAGPLTATAEAADRLRQGNRNALLPVLTGRDEVAVLSQSLRALVNDLTDSEARYRRLLDTANEGIIEVSSQDRITYLNARMAAMLGYGPDALLDRTVYELVFPEEAASTRARRAQRREGIAEQYELRMRRKDGTEIWTVANVSIVRENGLYTGTFSMITDITERKRAEDALRQSETQLRLAYKAANIASWDWDLPTDRMRWSPQFDDLFGAALPADPRFDDWAAHIVSEDRAHTVAALGTIVADGEGGSVEYRVLHPDRGMRWMLAVGTLLRDASGKALRMTGVTTDITDRKRLELEPDALL